ncbi:MAG: methylmalonyl Co-A mutase-associated GTPase MeaB [Euryarchaeota archaeon]|nr:methylmalonyl Co-A mutase-associated GTPase MeaB [Euryarchaeota archaeon]
MGLAEKVATGDRRAAARLISMIEDGDESVRTELADLHCRGGRAHIVGVTGSPGAGKSTLIHKLALEWRRRGRTVGIIAVDPSSPFTGGALLGDRIRMQELSTDRGVFIRSMSSRGNPGGVAKATADAVRVLDALGMDKVIVETVGAGQSEVAVMDVVHTVLVVVVPGLGDDIQAIKAGILEIGDLFVINKADRDGVEAAQRELEMMLELSSEKGPWTPPIVKTVARTGDGIPELVGKIDEHWEMIRREGLLEESERQRCRREVLELLKHKAVLSLLSEYGPDEFDALIHDVARRKLHPHDAVERIMGDKKRKN